MDHGGIPFLRELVVFLFVAGVVVPLMQRLRLSAILCYLLAGVALGPYGAGRLFEELPLLRHFAITDASVVRPLGDLGVVFLLFTVGLELSLRRLWMMRRLVFGLGTAQVTLTAITIAAIASMFGHAPANMIILGACLALSSTAVVVQLLSERHALDTPLGRLCFGILLLQDLAVVPILFATQVLGRGEGEVLGLPLLLALGKAALAIAVILAAGRWAMRPLFSLVGTARHPEVFRAITLLVALGAAMGTEAMGLSLALGAFLAGLLIADSDYRHEVEVDMAPLKGLLLGFFFLSVGVSIDLTILAGDAVWVALSVAGLYLLKTAIVAGLARVFGHDWRLSIEAGLMLGQGGEFAFVVLGLAAQLRVLPSDVSSFMIMVASLSMLVTPFAAMLGRRLPRRLARGDGDAEGAGAPAAEGRVVIAGYGRVGRMVGRMLEGEGVPFLALDLDGRVVSGHGTADSPVVYGDASRIAMLRRIDAGAALALVVAADDARTAESLVAAARREWPDLKIFARARDLKHAARLRDLGATDAVAETIESSLHLAGRLLHALGTDEDTVAQRIEEARDAAFAGAAATGAGSPHPTPSRGSAASSRPAPRGSAPPASRAAPSRR